ncbi:DNA polymerase III subunit gamma/tau [Marinomonas mediterranea]|uniref:DNA polymerase III subunit gamma/tau n=1 Tax=Marinomonas mediterranea TaxID=119864 RepID=UPI00234A09B2|nr:DNA polymerase III subunit gamma/tau [Marinomonas mediterranea]WCN09552.1 DNA polymerase III subunit gamma/tau [Marinomonas mediterranea]
MSYQVLARKWRPQTFLEMAGQDHVLQALVNALRQQRLHHAYLFTGTRGVGKTTIARIFAKSLNCETNGISPEPCGTCSSCTEIAEGRFVDLIEVDAASRTKVEDTRELLENVQYAPTRGRFKVYLIDEVHMLSTHSFNALLKTLEEPPEHVKFLLATTDPQKLPVTILSRCLQFNLKNMSAQRVVDYLHTVLNAENVGYDQAALWQIGQAANGSMRDALSLTDQAIAFGDGQITETGVTSMLGLVNQSQIISLLEVVADRNAALTLQKINELADYQPDFAAICASLLDTLHRIAVEQQVPGVLVDQLGDLERIQHIARTVMPEDVQVMYQSLMVGRRDLHLAHSPKAGFEMLMLRMIAFRPQLGMTVSHDTPPTVSVSSLPASSTSPVSAPSVSASESASQPTASMESTDSSVSQYGDEINTGAVPPKKPEAQPNDSTLANTVSTQQPVDSAEVVASTDAVPSYETTASKISIANETGVVAINADVAEEVENEVEKEKRLQRNVAEKSVVEERIAESKELDHQDTPPWEESVASAQVDVATESAPSLNESAHAESNIPAPQEEHTYTEDVPAVSDNVSAAVNATDSVKEHDGAARMREVSELLSQAPVEEPDDEDEDEAEERAIAETVDPFNPAADLVDNIGVSDSHNADQEESASAEQNSQQKTSKVDSVTQPALGMPLPSIAHFSETTMQIWWLIAPRLPLTGLVYNIAMNSSLISASEQGLRLQVPLEYGHMLNQSRYEQIQSSLSDFFNMPVPLIIDTVEEVEGVTAEEFAASKRAEALQAAINHLNSHPVVQAISNAFGGQLIYDTVKVKA